MLTRQIRYWLHSSEREDELREEMRAHLAEKIGELQSSGLTKEDATHQARKLFGNTELKHEESREVWISRYVSELWRDVRHSGRLLRRAPGFSLCVIVSMAVGISAATTTFSIVDPLLFRALPFREGNRLVSVGVNGPIDTNEFAIANMYFDWRDQQRVFTSMTAMLPGTDCDIRVGRMQRVSCVAVQNNFLPTLGVVPEVGRNFSKEEDQPKHPLAILISDRLWHGLSGGRSDLIGTVVQVDDRPARIIGVLPSDFVLPQGASPDLLLPGQIDEVAARSPQATVFLRAFARLKPAISLRRAQEQMETLFRSSIDRYVPRELRREVRPVIRSVRDRSLQEAKLASWLLLGVVSFLVLLSCLTVANLVIARSVARTGEFSMRAALGAGRLRLLRQSIVETMFLSLIGGGIGCFLSVLLLRALIIAAPGGFLKLEQAHIDRRVLLFSLLVSVLSAAIAGLASTLRAPSSNLVRTTQLSPGALRIRRTLLVAQLACSLVLLTAALLFGSSLYKLEKTRAGFAEQNLYTASFNLSHARYSQPGRTQTFYSELEHSLQEIPGVTSFALSDSKPPSGSTKGRPFSNLKIEGRGPVSQSGGMVSFRYVTPSYFKTLGIRVVEGRTFNDSERGQESSLILSESLARRLFPRENALGQRLSLDGGTAWLTVIGIAQDVKNMGLEAPSSPEYYRVRGFRSTQLGSSAVAFFRSALDHSTLDRWVHERVSRIDPLVPIKFENMTTEVHHLADRPRFVTFLLGGFALTSLVLAGVGVFGVVSFLVTSRRGELAIRSAVGATRTSLVLLVQTQVALWTTIGITAGLIVCVALGRLIRGLLFQVTPYDPLVMGGAALLLGCVAIAAAWLPSVRAGRVDPANILRSQ